ncbi:S9 family peptidase [Acidobacteriota bacterium]
MNIMSNRKSYIFRISFWIVFLFAFGCLWTSFSWSEVQEEVSRHHLRIEDFYRMESVGKPAISPDGLNVVYVRNFTIEKQNLRHEEIWMVATDGSRAPFRLTAPSFDARSPEWSPDGTLLALSSRRPVPGEEKETSTSYWFLRMDQPAGEAFQIEGLGGAPVFSPDNKLIAFTKDVPPGPKPEKTYASEFEQNILQRFDGKIYDWMNFRFDRRGYLLDPRDSYETPSRELHILPLSGGKAKQITKLGFNVSDEAWDPESRSLAFIADSHQRDEYTYERADLWTVSREGNVRRLTDDGNSYSNPCWSPDGKLIAILGRQGLDMVIKAKQDHGSPTDLYIVPDEGGGPQNLTKDWDLIPRDPEWSPDGDYIYFNSLIGGNSHLFRIRSKGGQVEQMTDGERRLSDFSFSSDFVRMAYIGTDPTHPVNVFTSRIDGTSERRLTESNKELLSEISLSQAERILYKSQDGTPIEGWILKPYDLDPQKPSYPMVLVIHGGPHGAYGNDFSFHRQLLAAQGYFVLYTNPRASVGYGEEFRWATWGGWGFLDYEDIMAGVDHALKHYPIDEGRLGVTGASYGGFMTNWIITHTKRFAAAVSRASISNWVSDYGVADIPRTKESEFFGPPWEKGSLDLLLRSSPLVYAKDVTTPTLFLHGEIDYRVPIEEAEQMYMALKKQRVPSQFIRYPESYHGGWTPWRSLHARYYELKWWERYLLQKNPD